MSNWLIRIQNGVAYVWQRQYVFNLFALPWALHGGTRVIFTPDSHDNIEEAAMSYIRERDPRAKIQIHFIPWS